ncbi:hypothetical protein NMF85_10740 [Clostridioides difficile]|uniref:hypothetical protein n=1 Tax=Clostridioides difficile TaxID=1496 RepID=UPI001430D9CF|nr:hypothetical protein [Clostridioides difficile]MCK3747745.1 hypothetical protein [Clostridioides difficile]MCP8397032.1 hypothetical protein [Clostridioides difficile]MCP8415784.1 hypothetical protein [Clostridioides difficile]MCP8493746.1 hypothetical protein [Clostridioides difficile]MCP8656870.1 hypothetical protein [Clostridioides difficile]
MIDLDIEIKINELEKRGYFRVDKDYILQNINKKSALYRKHVEESLNGNFKKELLIAIKCEGNIYFYSREFIEKNSVIEILESTKKHFVK